MLKVGSLAFRASYRNGGVEQFNMQLVKRSDSLEHIEKLDVFEYRVLNEILGLFTFLWRCRDFDRIYIQYGSFYDLLYILFAKMIGKRDVRAIMHCSQGWRHLDNKLLLVITRLFLMCGTSVYTLTEEQSEILGKSINCRQVSTIIDQRFLRIRSEGVTSDIATDDYWLFIGRVVKEKGVEDLIKVLPFIDENLVIVGNVDESYKKELLGNLCEKYIQKIQLDCLSN